MSSSKISLKPRVDFFLTTRENTWHQARLDHRFNTNNEISVTYRYGHDLEESPDVQSLTAYSAGSSTHTNDNDFQVAWYRQFSAATPERGSGAVGLLQL